VTDRVWEELSRTLRSSAPYRSLLGGVRDVVRLPTPAAAWIGELLAADRRRPLLVLVPREADALAWIEAARLVSSDDRVVYFPAPSLTPYQETETSLLVRAQESAALDRVLAGTARTVVTTPRSLFRRLPRAEAYRQAVLPLEPGDERSLERLSRHLLDFGFRRTDLVYEVGDFAVRGGLLDVFPPGEEAPLRLDFFGDTLESIRWFDPQSQRSEATVARVRILPLTLFPSGQEAAQAVARALTARAGAELGIEAAEHVEALRTRAAFPGWENYLPLIAPTIGLAEMLERPLLIALDPPALAAELDHHAERLAEEARARAEHGRLAPLPEELEHPVAAVRASVESAELRVGELLPAALGGEAADFKASLTDLFHGQLPRFPQEIATNLARGERCLVVAPAAHRQRLEELLGAREIRVGPGGVELVSGELSRGFRLPPAGVAVYGEQQLLPQAKLQRRPSRSRFDVFLSSMRDLKVGDYVVHSDHGIGQFVALRTVGSDGDGSAALPPSLVDHAGAGAAIETEVMEITYASGRRLLLPLTRLDQVQKFSGIEGVAPRLDQLGGSSWNRTKTRVKSGMRDLAAELLRLYAERQVARAPAMGGDSDLQGQFEAAFAYEESPDQLEAINVVKDDLQRERPMDRLLCGDVGYGKTEVAMRAAFKVVDGGGQVALLAPTTILADQHLETFRRRFAGFPVTIEMVSRFRQPQETREIRKRVAEGKVDILIGTHRLLSRDIQIPRLALLIVDEEQRFGVAQKERLKQLKKEVHVLAMSATPVPRTLQLSLAGVRDLSVIETPPKDRMAVETAILPYNADLVREAIEFEVERGGQVYYVYNRVESIEKVLTSLR
jgi:transcription-repair coupling factor (superfamily II helicase)